MYNGICQTVSASNNVRARLDLRDFSLAIAKGIFLQMSDTYLITSQGMETDFLPSIDLMPVTVPIAVTDLVTINIPTPEVIGFDVDLVTNRTFIHFTHIMNLGRFSSTAFTLHAGTNPGAPIVTLTSGSRPPGTANRNVKTVCIAMSDVDVQQLYQNSICSNSTERCYCSFTASLGVSYRDISVTRRISSNRLQVSYIANSIEHLL